MNTFQAHKSNLLNQMQTLGMTFNPSVDCRNDLINHYGYTAEQVSGMCDGEVFSIMDKIEADHEGYVEDVIELPAVYQDEKCSCGNKWTVQFIDSETRGDCEIYECTCTSCGADKSFNYAGEWFDEDCY